MAPGPALTATADSPNTQTNIHLTTANTSDVDSVNTCPHCDRTFASHIDLIVPKATSGNWTPCGDYPVLNNANIPDRKPVPHFQDFAGALFSKIDLVRSFHRKPVAPEDISSIAVNTQFGLFEFIRMIFGHYYVAQTSQRFIDHISRCLTSVYACMDDHLVGSQNAENHKVHLALVFDRVKNCGVVTDPSGLIFGVPSYKFFGHHVDFEDLRPLQSKAEAIPNFPPPNSKCRFQQFIDMVNFYRLFQQNWAALMLLLSNILIGPKGPVKLTDEAPVAFEGIKKYNPRVTARLDYMSKLTTGILHIDDTENAVADVLSRTTHSALHHSHVINRIATVPMLRRVG
ncbi:hypothetical protein SprV_0301194500 [Sparganum proliferum]